MMIIQVLLIAVFVLVGFRLLANPEGSRMRAWKKVIGLAFVLMAVLVVLLPELANDVARAVGIGRGADLLLYSLTAGAVFAWLNGYIKSKKVTRDMVVLARKIAIIEAVERRDHPHRRNKA